MGQSPGPSAGIAAPGGYLPPGSAPKPQRQFIDPSVDVRLATPLDKQPLERLEFKRWVLFASLRAAVVDLEKSVRWAKPSTCST